MGTLNPRRCAACAGVRSDHDGVDAGAPARRRGATVHPCVERGVSVKNATIHVQRQGGTLRRKAPGIPGRTVPSGSWTVQIDFERSYNPKAAPRLTGTTTVFKTFRRG